MRNYSGLNVRPIPLASWPLTYESHLSPECESTPKIPSPRSRTQHTAVSRIPTPLMCVLLASHFVPRERSHRIYTIWAANVLSASGDMWNSHIHYEHVHTSIPLPYNSAHDPLLPLQSNRVRPAQTEIATSFTTSVHRCPSLRQLLILKAYSTYAHKRGESMLIIIARSDCPDDNTENGMRRV
jgi:hypothetical protein